jgi:hypothetical protein
MEMLVGLRSRGSAGNDVGGGIIGANNAGYFVNVNYSTSLAFED